MSIFKRGTVYWYHFLFNGEHIQKSSKQGNPRIARQIEAAYKTALAKGEVGIIDRKKVSSFQDAMKDFLTWSKQDHQMASSSAERYHYSSLALLKFFGDKRLDKITAEEVERYKTSRAAEFKTVRGKNKKRTPTKERLRPATINRELACLRAMFNHAIKSDMLLTNPISKTAAKVLREDNEQTRVLTYDEQEKYLAKASPVLFDVATLMLETGMRPEEVYRIRPENVHLSDDYLFNPYGKTKAAKRRIKLTDAVKSILNRRMKEAATRASGKKHEGDFLFPCEGDATRPLPGIQSAHARALRESKVAQFRPYDCRHTWATRAVEAGIDLVTLAAMLGHSKINMVLRYAHPTQEHQTNAMDKMELYVRGQKVAHEERKNRQGRQAITSPATLSATTTNTDCPKVM
jgi:integrase